MTHYHVRDSFGTATFAAWASAHEYADWCQRYTLDPRPAVIECGESPCSVSSAQWKAS